MFYFSFESRLFVRAQCDRKCSKQNLDIRVCWQVDLKTTHAFSAATNNYFLDFLFQIKIKS